MIEAALQLQRPQFELNVTFRTNAHVTGVFGPSGAGKSTLINLLAGLERPKRGLIVVNGRTLFDSDKRINIPAHWRRIGIVFQEHRLFPHMTVQGNLRYAGGVTTTEFNRIVALLELESMLRRRVPQLSGGERQRVALGRVLLSNPDVLLFDEPLASLDLRLKQQILPWLQRVRDESDIAMLYVSHDLGEILQLTDQLLVMERGRLVGQGSFCDIVHDERVLGVMHDRGLQNVLPARVVEHRHEDGITMLEVIPAGKNDADSPRNSARLAAPLIAAACGDVVKVSVRPWDIALAVNPVEAVSIQNQVRGEVRRCSLHERRALVEIDIGAPVIVEVSRRSASSLNLHPGASVVCLIKSHAIQYVGSI